MRNVLIRSTYFFAIITPWVHRIVYENFRKALPDAGSSLSHWMAAILSVITVFLVLLVEREPTQQEKDSSLSADELNKKAEALKALTDARMHARWENERGKEK